MLKLYKLDIELLNYEVIKGRALSRTPGLGRAGAAAGGGCQLRRGAALQLASVPGPREEERGGPGPRHQVAVRPGQGQ